ncbi:cardiolipin synthase 2 [Citrobacter koseri]|uniref:Cardiolipin synthase 2 n=1 Tax=Citrobacter koseri TaxID=545 RepID=A0A2X2V5D4_CITKO|nr:cardiolipin synthase 2 [Citrobacter koseri]
MKCGWREGNQIQLLENGDQFYPAVFDAIAQAQQRIILETFIWFEDDVGKQLHAALLKAARRGVKAEVLLDGYGSPRPQRGVCRGADRSGGNLPLLRSASSPVRHAHQPLSPYAP